MAPRNAAKNAAQLVVFIEIVIEYVATLALLEGECLDTVDGWQRLCALGSLQLQNIVSMVQVGVQMFSFSDIL